MRALRSPEMLEDNAAASTVYPKQRILELHYNLIREKLYKLQAGKKRQLLIIGFHPHNHYLPTHTVLQRETQLCRTAVNETTSQNISICSSHSDQMSEIMGWRWVTLLQVTYGGDAQSCIFIPSYHSRLTFIFFSLLSFGYFCKMSTNCPRLNLSTHRHDRPSWSVKSVNYCNLCLFRSSLSFGFFFFSTNSTLSLLLVFVFTQCDFMLFFLI